jgi:hypothetical protein
VRGAVQFFGEQPRLGEGDMAEATRLSAGDRAHELTARQGRRGDEGEAARAILRGGEHFLKTHNAILRLDLHAAHVVERDMRVARIAQRGVRVMPGVEEIPDTSRVWSKPLHRESGGAGRVLRTTTTRVRPRGNILAARDRQSGRRGI